MERGSTRVRSSLDSAIVYVDPRRTSNLPSARVPRKRSKVVWSRASSRRSREARSFDRDAMPRLELGTNRNLGKTKEIPVRLEIQRGNAPPSGVCVSLTWAMACVALLGPLRANDIETGPAGQEARDAGSAPRKDGSVTTLHDAYHAYIGTYTRNGSEGIYRLRFDARTGDVELAGAT